MKTITYSGRTLSVSQWAEELGISSAAIGQRIKRGWTDVEAISTPGGGAVPARLERERAKATPAKSAPIKSVVTKRAPTPAKAAKPAATVSPPRDRAEVSGPVELLARLGYTVEDLGDHPRGRLFVIAKAS